MLKCLNVRENKKVVNCGVDIVSSSDSAGQFRLKLRLQLTGKRSVMSIDRSAWRKDIGNKERRKRCNDERGERGREVESWRD